MKIDADFVVFCMQRSGSHMLAQALHSHPDIVFHAELFDFVRYPLKYVRVPGKRNCVIVMYNQIELADTFGVDLAALPVIHLTRDDRETAISNIRNNLAKAERGAAHTPHYTSPDQVPEQSRYAPREDEIASWLTMIAGWRAAALPKLEQNQRVIRIDYAEITGGRDIREIPSSVSEKLCAFLGLPIHPLNVDIIKSS